MAGPVFAGRLEERFGLADDAEQSLGDLEQGPPDGRQPGLALGPVEQGDAIGRLEIANLLGDRRLRDVQLLCRAGEAAGLGDGVEGPDLRIFHRKILSIR